MIFYTEQHDRCLIKICKFDKGRGVAVLNSENYYAKLHLIASDTTKFVEIPIKEHETHPVIKKKKFHQQLY